MKSCKIYVKGLDIMKFVISGKNIDVTEGLKKAVEDKLGKLERYFTSDTEIIVTLSVEKERQKIEVTIPVKGNIIRSEQVSSDMYVSIDLVEEIIERQLRKFVGPPLKDCFRIVYGYTDDALLSQCVHVYRQEYRKTGMHLCHMYDGLYDLMTQLRGMGIKTGVCTLKYEKLAKLIFEEKGISSLLDTVRGTDEAGEVTKAECIRRAVSDFAIEPSQALMVGDTVNDLKGAEEAGVPFHGASGLKKEKNSHTAA